MTANKSLIYIVWRSWENP